MVAEAENLVLLHGFSGTRRAWDGVIARLDRECYRPLALDLPGHGSAAVAALGGEPLTFASCVTAVLDASPERFVLCGYSLGGRVAMHVALAAPERLARLVLVSSGPGIEDDRERAARRAADRALADQLERLPFDRFIDGWRAQPLFAADPHDVQERARADQRRNDPRALAAVLRGIGAGEMAPLWDRLGDLTMPVSVVVGRRDRRYRAVAGRMIASLRSGRLVVLEGGHALTLENPGGIVRALAADRRTGVLATRRHPHEGP